MFCYWLEHFPSVCSRSTVEGSGGKDPAKLQHSRAGGDDASWGEGTHKPPFGGTCQPPAHCSA